jgi:hypothetical protein
MDMEAREKLIELNEQRRLGGCNSIAYINSKKLAYVNTAMASAYEHIQ